MLKKVVPRGGETKVVQSSVVRGWSTIVSSGMYLQVGSLRVIGGMIRKLVKCHVYVLSDVKRT